MPSRYYRPVSYTPPQNDYNLPNPFATRGPADYLGAAADSIMAFGDVWSRNQENVRQNNLELQREARQASNDSFNHFLKSLEATAAIETQRQQSIAFMMNVAEKKFDFEQRQAAALESQATRAADASLASKLSAFEVSAATESLHGDAAVLYHDMIQDPNWGKATTTQKRVSEIVTALSQAPKSTYSNFGEYGFGEVLASMKEPNSSPRKLAIAADLILKSGDKELAMAAFGYTSPDDQRRIQDMIRRRPAALSDPALLASVKAQIAELEPGDFAGRSEILSRAGFDEDPYFSEVSAATFNTSVVPDIVAAAVEAEAVTKTPGIASQAHELALAAGRDKAVLETVRSKIGASPEEIEAAAAKAATSALNLQLFAQQNGFGDRTIRLDRLVGRDTSVALEKSREGDWKGSMGLYKKLVEYKDRHGVGSDKSSPTAGVIGVSEAVNRVAKEAKTGKKSLPIIINSRPEEWVSADTSYNKASASLNALTDPAIPYAAKVQAYEDLKLSLTQLDELTGTSVGVTFFTPSDLDVLRTSGSRRSFEKLEGLINYARSKKSLSDYYAEKAAIPVYTQEPGGATVAGKGPKVTGPDDPVFLALPKGAPYIKPNGTQWFKN